MTTRDRVFTFKDSLFQYYFSVHPGFLPFFSISINFITPERRDVAKLISTVFNSQVFLSGFVHVDPHPANVLLRNHPNKPGKPQLVLVDHGLYKQIDDEFRSMYAHLWKALLLADIPKIKSSCEKLGVSEMVRILQLAALVA